MQNKKINFINKIAAIIFPISFFLLIFRPNVQGFAIAFILTTIFEIAIIKSRNTNFIKQQKNKISTKEILLFTFTFLILGLGFFDCWIPSGIVQRLCMNNNTIEYIALIMVAILLSVPSYIFLNNIKSLILNSNIFKNKNAITTNSKPLNVKVILFLFLLSIFTITLCSKCSPIYPFNDWLDINCFFTVGKATVKGQVMYKDIFEQKGPILYFIYSLSYLISNTTFFGTYLLEILFCFLFLLSSYKTMLLFTNSKVLYIIPVMTAFIYSSSAFTHGGSAEEFCLPAVSLALCLGLKSLVKNVPFTKISGYLLGITLGYVLWIKYTMLGFYIGFILFMIFFYIGQKWIKELFQTALFTILGIATISIPVLIYFIANNAITDLFTVYFYNNMFLYSIDNGGNKLLNLINNLNIGFTSFSGVYIFGLVGIIISIYLSYIIHSKSIAKFLISIAVFAFFFVYMGGRDFGYYSLIFSVFAPIFMAYINSIFISKVTINNNASKKIATIGLFAISLVLMLIFSPNTYMLKYKKEDLPQFKFDKIISQTKNPTLLNYGFLDGGFYTVSDIMPTCKYYCTLSVPYQDMYDTQNRFVDEGLTDYIVTRNYEIENTNYQCVSNESFYFEGHNQKYYLYSLIKER